MGLSKTNPGHRDLFLVPLSRAVNYGRCELMREHGYKYATAHQTTTQVFNGTSARRYATESLPARQKVHLIERMRHPEKVFHEIVYRHWPECVHLRVFNCLSVPCPIQLWFESPSVS